MRSLTISNLLRTLQWWQRPVPCFRSLTAEFRPTTVQVQTGVTSGTGMGGFSQSVGPPPPFQSHYHSISTPQTLHLSNSGSCQHYSITRRKIDGRGCARYVARKETEDSCYNSRNSSAEHKFETETLGWAGLLEKAHRAMACANTWKVPNVSGCIAMTGFYTHCSDSLAPLGYLCGEWWLISYRRFGETYRPHPPRYKNPNEFSLLLRNLWNCCFAVRARRSFGGLVCCCVKLCEFRVQIFVFILYRNFQFVINSVCWIYDHKLFQNFYIYAVHSRCAISAGWSC
jgi:hypothetical protein